MTKKELFERLKNVHDDTTIMILDGSNGGGSLREINLGPRPQKVTRTDANESADCEELVGKRVWVMGYGCY